jgi:STE24 endopeptidase
MPLSLLIALVLAFGFDLHPEGGALAHEDLVNREWEAAGGLSLIAAVAIALGQWVALRAARPGGPDAACRRLFYFGGRTIEVLTLAVFAWIIHGLDWPRVVERGWGFRQAILIDELLVLAPFLLGQLVGWWGLYAAETAIRRARYGPGRVVGLARHMILKARQSWGLVLPAATVYALARDLLRNTWPGAVQGPSAQLAGMVLMGLFVLVMAPLFVRLTWPTRPLPAGALRDRLEQLAQRFRFRCTDILVWDTGGTLVNAGVTGALPWYRYVLLSDALIDGLEDREIEAVFGHEVGHIAHKHLSFFGFFFVGSMGVMGLAERGIGLLLGLGPSLPVWPWGADQATLADLARGGILLLGFALYFLLVFGFLSRRFERQADVFGCRTVSCNRAECPPHADLNGCPTTLPPATALCPVGIRIFANALANVASMNGMEHSARSWRHGSIHGRIRFLEGLEGRPDAVRSFQKRVGLLRLFVALALLACLAAAFWSGALDQF